MKKRALWRVLLTLTLAALCAPAQASTWQICRMELRISDAPKPASAQLQAEVLKATPSSATADCPTAGTTLTFVPETADYQTLLPRRAWPKKGQSVQVDYRYLDGICKGDGNDHPCRIKHYPVVTRPQPAS